MTLIPTFQRATDYPFGDGSPRRKSRDGKAFSWLSFQGTSPREHPHPDKHWSRPWVMHRGQVSVAFLAPTSLMAPSNQVALNPTGKCQIGSSAEIPGQGARSIMLSDPTPAHKHMCSLDELLPPLGRKIPSCIHFITVVSFFRNSLGLICFSRSVPLAAPCELC